jgi:2-haloacid dehalogenase
MATLAFDVYGTLIDTNGVLSQLQEWIGPQAEVFSETWRSKQLEYSFRRGLMRQYESFAVCTRHALDYCCAHYKVSLSGDQKDALLQCYRRLPAFTDVEDSLIALRAGGHRLFAFSNGSAEAVEAVLQANALRGHLDGVVSCEALETFKPNPDVYQYCMKQVDDRDDAWLVSGNPFDVIGAQSAGMKSAWVRRSAATVFDPWGEDPSLIVESLSQLNEKLALYKEQPPDPVS